MKKLIVFVLAVVLFGSCKKDDDYCAGFTNILDNNFEQYLINLGYDNNIDGQVLTSNICAIDTLIIGDTNILDLSGIEDFIGLTHLAFDCKISNIDLSKNISLTHLSVIYTDLSSLDLSRNLQIEYLIMTRTPIISLNLGTNSNLKELECPYNYQLESLDLSNNINLELIYVNDNNLLICLNLKNINITSLDYDFHPNPNLTCIEVDDPNWATQNMFSNSGQWTFSSNCNNSAGCF